jgi:hypothetical protein
MGAEVDIRLRARARRPLAGVFDSGSCRTHKLSQPETRPRKWTALAKNMMRKRLGSSALLGWFLFPKITLAMRNRLRMVKDVTNNTP